MLKISWLAAGVAVAALAAGSAQAADPFYAGKTITFIGGLAPGGGGDLVCRQIAQYIGAHIAGNPTIIDKNMPSTDGIIALNYVGEEAKKDGLTQFCGSYNAELQITKNPALKTDLSKFNYVTGNGDPQIFLARTDIPPGLKTPMDIFNVKQSDIVYGGGSISSHKDIGARLGLEVLGLKDFKYVTGFSGDAQSRAALQQKFVNLIEGAMSSYSQVIAPTMVKDGEAMPIFQAGLADANGVPTVRDPRVPDVPTLYELYQQKFGKPPSGPVWQLETLMQGIGNVALYALALPDGSPPEAVAAMNAAIEPLNHDPDFISGIEKLLGKGARQQPGSVVVSQVKAYIDMPQDLQDLYFATIKSGEAMAQNNSGKK